MSKPPEPKPEAKATARPSLVKVRVKGPQPMSEDGLREPGAVFEVTAERAAALGPLVFIV